MLLSLIQAFFAFCVGIYDPSDWSYGIHDAVRNGDAVRVWIMVAIHPNTANLPELYAKGFPRSPVHRAAEYNQFQVLKVLLDHGGDVNDRGKSGMTPLQWAAWNHHFEAAELLLNRGAALDIFSAAALNKRAEVEEALKLAEKYGLQQYIANMQSKGPFFSSNPLLNWAVQGSHADMIELIIRHGGNVNPTPSQWIGKTVEPPLYIAVRYNRIDTIDILIKHGADLETKDLDGSTPLDIAAFFGKVAIAKKLLKHGARTDNRKDQHIPRISDIHIGISMDTPLHSAALYYHPEMIALLLAHGAAPNAVNANGHTPLDIIEQQVQDSKLKKQIPKDIDCCLKLLYRYGGKRGTGEKCPRPAMPNWEYIPAAPR